MNDNEIVDEKTPPFMIAGLACLMCLPIIYLTTRLLIWLLHVQWLAWPLLAVWALVPIAVAFVVLYRSEWHREWSKVRRVFSILLSSCIILGMDLLVVVLLTAAGCLIIGLTRVVGGN